MKKSILKLVAFATFATFATFASSQTTQKVYQQYAVGSNLLFNTQNGYSCYSLNTFSRVDNDSTPTKGFYTKLGLAIPENRFIGYLAIGVSLPASKTNVDRFIDLGLTFQGDFKSKKEPEMYNMIGLESAYRWDNIGKLNLINFRVGLIAGYHNYKTLNAATKMNDESKAGFRLMPTLSVSINLYSKSKILTYKALRKS